VVEELLIIIDTYLISEDFLGEFIVDEEMIVAIAL